MDVWIETKRSSRIEVRKLKSDTISEGMREACFNASNDFDYETIRIGTLRKFTHSITKETIDSADYLGCGDETLWDACD